MTQEQETPQLSERDHQALDIGRRELARQEAYERTMNRLRRFIWTPHGFFLTTTAGIIAFGGAYFFGSEMGREEEKEPVRVEEFRETPTVQTTQVGPTATQVPPSESPFPTFERPTPTTEPTSTPEGPTELQVGETLYKGNLAVTLKQPLFHDTSLGQEMELEWEFKNVSNDSIQLAGLSKDNWQTIDNLGRTFIDKGQTTLQRFSSCKFIADEPSYIAVLDPGQATILCMSIAPEEGLFNPGGLEEIRVTLNTNTIENATWKIKFQQ